MVRELVFKDRMKILLIFDFIDIKFFQSKMAPQMMSLMRLTMENFFDPETIETQNFCFQNHKFYVL